MNTRDKARWLSDFYAKVAEGGEMQALTGAAELGIQNVRTGNLADEIMSWFDPETGEPL